MKAFLMYRNRDFRLDANVPPNAPDLMQDLGLETLFRAMSAGDEFLFEVAKKSVLTSLHEPEAILYRQHILADCLERPDVVRELHAIAVEALVREQKAWGWMSTTRYPEGTLHRSREVLQIFVDLLKRLRRVADGHGRTFHSEGFARLFGMIVNELDDEYLSTVADHLRRLAFRNGVLISAELGKGNQGTNYILRKPPHTRQSWFERLQGWVERLPARRDSQYVYEIADRDEAGYNALSELRGRGISHVAAALAQSTDHILAFFRMFRLELGFYVACLNLRDQLAKKGKHVCFPEPSAVGKAVFSSRGLYDVCLSLTAEDEIVGNDLTVDGRLLVMITGANRGGKSTFLRSVGLAQLMMQCGMFAPAEFLRANVCAGIYTHFKRGEDTSMRSGKLERSFAE